MAPLFLAFSIPYHAKSSYLCRVNNCEEPTSTPQLVASSSTPGCSYADKSFPQTLRCLIPLNGLTIPNIFQPQSRWISEDRRSFTFDREPLYQLMYAMHEFLDHHGFKNPTGYCYLHYMSEIFGDNHIQEIEKYFSKVKEIIHDQIIQRAANGISNEDIALFICFSVIIDHFNQDQVSHMNPDGKTTISLAEHFGETFTDNWPSEDKKTQLRAATLKSIKSFHALLVETLGETQAAQVEDKMLKWVPLKGHTVDEYLPPNWQTFKALFPPSPSTDINFTTN